MPDQDLFDLDTAFARLERDIAGISSPRGAGLAVSTARRRRRTTIASVAAVAVLAVAGVAIGQGVGRHDGGIGPSDQPVPDPTPLTVQTFSAATAGWVGGWGLLTASSPQSHLLAKLTCLDDGIGGNSPLNKADQTGGALYVAGSTEIAYVVGLKFANGDVDAAEQAMTRGAQACNPFAITSTTYPDGSSVTYYDLPGTGSSAYFQLLVAHYGDRLGLAVIGGAQDIPSSDTVTRLDDLMMGILQVDGTFSQVPAGDAITGSSSSASASISEAQRITDADFADALGTWSNQWQRQGTKVDVTALPCAGDWAGGSGSGRGSGLGANGDQEFASFDSARGGSRRRQRPGRTAPVLHLRAAVRDHDERLLGRRLAHGHGQHGLVGPRRVDPAARRRGRLREHPR